MTESNSTLWTAPPHPNWLEKVNQEGTCFDLEAVVPLDANSLISHAQRATGLDDFDDDSWREPFTVLLDSLEKEAELTLMGRLMARSDIIIWLSTRLQLEDTLRRNPEILDEVVEAPMIIVGLWFILRARRALAAQA